MVLPDDCRANADECLRLATTAPTDTEKAAWLALAQCWLLLARGTSASVRASPKPVTVTGAGPAEVVTRSTQGRLGSRRRTNRQSLNLWLMTTGHAAMSDAPAIVLGLL